MSATEKMNGRLLSLDTLRGFDMFFITGGAGLIAALCGLFGWADGWLVRQMQHVPWEGLRQHDTIFPLFLFLAGVSWPFSLASQQARGRTTAQIHLKILLRAAILFLFGLSIGGILKFNPNFRIPSVLGYIGLSWGFAALLYLHVKSAKWRGVLIAALLIGAWAFLAFTGAPDAPAGAGLYSREGNIISWLDRLIMPNHILKKGVYEAESFFALPTGVALALLGMTAGTILRASQWTCERKAALLALSALASLLAGLFFIFVLKMPIVKALWTTSFVLIAAAYSFAMLALFYWIIDVKGWTRWTFYFRIIGLNSITVYMLMQMGVIGRLRDFFFSGAVEWLSGNWWASVIKYLGYQAVAWLILYFFYRKKIFLKV